MLPDGILDHFGRVLGRIRHTGIWPQQLDLNIMAMLGKASGGERCVGKTPMWWRCLCRLSSSGVAAWEQANALPQDVKDAKSLREFSKKFKFMFFD